jgi:hypothetical protein
VGSAAFFWLARQGFYSLILPGALAGLGAGLAKARSTPMAILCGFLGLAFSLYSEWRLRPFIADGSFAYFLAHLNQLQPLTLILAAVGAGIAFWVPFRRGKHA